MIQSSKVVEGFLFRIKKILPLSIFVGIVFATLQIDLSSRYLVEITITATGQKISPESKATEVWLVNPSAKSLNSHRFVQFKAPDWEIVSGMYVSRKHQPARLWFRGYFRKNEYIELLYSPYSGQASISINSNIQMLDLFGGSGTKKIPITDYVRPDSRSLIVAIRDYTTRALFHIFWIAVVLYALFPVYKRLPEPFPSEQRLTDSNRAPLLMLLAAASFLLFVCTFYPGVMTSDSYYQYLQAATLQFDDWHPPAMAALWSLTNRFVKGPGGFFLLQIFMSVGSVYLLCRVAAQKGKKLFFLPDLAIFFPPVTAILFVAWKDVSMAVSLLSCFSLWFFWKSKGELTKSKMLFVLLIAFYSACTRHNALLATLPFLFLFAADFTDRKKAAVFAILICGAFYIGNYFLSYEVLKAKRVYLTQQFLSHDLMAIYQSTHVNPFPPEYLDQAHLDQLMKKFTHLSMSPTMMESDRPWSVDPKVIHSLQSSWIKNVMEHPLVYLQHRWILFRSFVLDLDRWADSVTCPENTPPPDEVKNLPLRRYRQGVLASIHFTYQVWLYQYADFLFRGITYLIANVVLMIISIRRKNWNSGMINLSSFIYLATFFFVAPFSRISVHILVYFHCLSFYLCFVD